MNSSKQVLVLFGFLSMMVGAAGKGVAAFPLDLRGSVPEQASVTINVTKPAGAVNGTITLTTLDADSPGEGELIINGNERVKLFGSLGVSANDQKWVDITISTPASYWTNGNNTLLFRHKRTAGFVVSGAKVSFGSNTSSSSDSSGLAPTIGFSKGTIDFGHQNVGGISNPISVILSNNGSAPLDITALYATSNNFRQTNNCNNYLPSGGNCKINVTFIPTTSGAYSEKLTVSSNATGSPHTVSLAGIGADGGTSQSPFVPSGKLTMNVDFENRVRNSNYTKEHAIQDFNSNQKDGAINGPNSGRTKIVKDPAFSGRGNVLRVVHPAGELKQGGVSFKARFAKDNENKKGSARFDDVYLAYDLYLSPGYKPMAHHKLPGLVTGTLLEASHTHQQYNGTGIPPEGVISFTAIMQSFGLTESRRPYEGALAVYYYDAQKTAKAKYLDTRNPANRDPYNSYTMPTGRWFTIEQRVKLNTADSKDGYNSANDKKDGLAEIWINGIKMSTKQHLWRFTNTMKADGFWFISYYNDTSTTRKLGQTPPKADQYEFYDNFRVSTSPITH